MRLRFYLPNRSGRIALGGSRGLRSVEGFEAGDLSKPTINVSKLRRLRPDVTRSLGAQLTIHVIFPPTAVLAFEWDSAELTVMALITAKSVKVTTLPCASH
jgi:hypothetical protein